MREILFKAKRVDNGEWVYGCYAKFVPYKGDGVRHWIQPMREDGRMDVIREVIPETVGQYTGVDDKNGKEIYKGDVVAYNATKYEVSESYGTFILLRVDGDVIDYNDFPQSIFRCGSDTTEFIGCCNDYCVSLFELSNNEQDFEGFLSCEIIGNIHDGCKGGE